jgi:hypothetical protein
MAERQGQTYLVKQTRQFIAEDPTVINLTRTARNSDGAGGWTPGAPTPVAAQTVRLVPSNPSTGSEVRTVSGEVLKTTYSIVAMPDANIQEGDSFMVDGFRHEVVIVLGIGGYEVRAEVVRRG